jgi:hypothetical protein
VASQRAEQRGGVRVQLVVGPGQQHAEVDARVVRIGERGQAGPLVAQLGDDRRQRRGPAAHPLPEDPQGQRQPAAQLGQFGDGGRVGLGQRRADRAGHQRHRVGPAEPVQRDPSGTLPDREAA